MRFYADLHIHSKHSMACSRDCDLEHLAWWARHKGISVAHLPRHPDDGSPTRRRRW